MVEGGAQKEEDGQTWGINEWLVSISLQGYTDAMIEYDVWLRLADSPRRWLGGGDQGHD